MTTCSQDVANGEAEATGPAAPNPPPTPALEFSPPAGEAALAPTESAPETPAPKQGAPAANGNRSTHNLHADRGKQLVRLVLGSLSDSQGRVETDAYAYRRTLEDACHEAHGGVSLLQAHAIDTATRWFRHGQLALAWLREHGEKMEHSERLTFSKSVAESADRRDKAVERLDLAASSGVDDWYAALRAGALDVAPEPGKAAAAENGPEAAKRDGPETQATGDNGPDEAPPPEDHQPNHDP